VSEYGDVFFGGQINFIMPNCHSRMTGADLLENPGTVIGGHDLKIFRREFSATTAPFDYW